MNTNNKKIKFYYTQLPLKVGNILSPYLEVHFKTPFKRILSRNITEEIGREVLNNSKVLMKNKQPFIQPESEESGQSDNNGNNYSIDTKLLYMESACYQISKNEMIIRNNNKEYDYINDLMTAYQNYKKKIKPKNDIAKRQYEVIKKIYSFFNKYQKNLLLILPIPQYDLIYMENFDFNRSIMSGTFWTISMIKRDCKFKYDVYFAYPFLTNDYNLVKIGTKKYTCEPFIECSSQKKYLECTSFGMSFEKKFYPLIAEVHIDDNYTFTSHYRKNGK